MIHPNKHGNKDSEETYTLSSLNRYAKGALLGFIVAPFACHFLGVYIGFGGGIGDLGCLIGIGIFGGVGGYFGSILAEKSLELLINPSLASIIGGIAGGIAVGSLFPMVCSWLSYNM